MLLEKGDLKEIGKIVDVSVNKAVDKAKTELRAEIGESEARLEKKVGESEKRVISILHQEIGDSEKRIITIISREVTDLAEINYAVITRTDQIDHRLNVVERKLGIRSH